MKFVTKAWITEVTPKIVYDDHILVHELEEKPTFHYENPTVSSQNHSNPKKPTEIPRKRCEFCETDYKADEVRLHRKTCVQKHKCVDCDSYISLLRLAEHQQVCSHIKNQHKAAVPQEKPAGLRVLLPDSHQQAPCEESKLPSKPPTSVQCSQCSLTLLTSGTVQLEYDDHKLGHRLQQQSLLRQTQERRRKMAELRHFQQSYMNRGVAQHANDDAYFSPDNYEVVCTQELLKLDGDLYAPGKGLKVEGISLLQPYRYVGEPLECVICKEEIGRGAEVKRLPCMHVFHAGCIDEWVGRVPKCPVDNSKIEIG